MNQMLKSLVDRLEALPVEEQERVANDLNQRLTEIETTRLSALRDDIDAGIEQVRNGQTVDGEAAFARIKSKYAL